MMIHADSGAFASSDVDTVDAILVDMTKNFGECSMSLTNYIHIHTERKEVHSPAFCVITESSRGR